MQRNAITWEDEFIFDYLTDPATTTAPGNGGADTTSPKSVRSWSSDEDEEIVWQNEAVNDCSCGMEAAAAVNVEPQPITFSVSALLGALRHTEDEEV